LARKVAGLRAHHLYFEGKVLIKSVDKCTQLSGAFGEDILQSKKIIYVDDEPANTKLIQKAFKNTFDVTTLSSSAEFLEQWQTLAADLVLLDVQMPDIDGYEVCQQLREAGFHKPIMFISAHTGLKDRLKGYEAGGEDYIGKPFDLEELEVKIKGNLEKSAALEAAQKNAMESQQFAFTAMISASEIGQVVQFVQSVFRAETAEQITQAIGNTFQNYEVKAVMCVRAHGIPYFSGMGGSTVSNLEQQLLMSHENAKKITTLGNRCLFVNSGVSILVKNMPESEDKVGRLRDHIASILDATNQHIKFVESQQLREQSQQQFLIRLQTAARDTISRIDHASNDARNTAAAALEEAKLEIQSLEYHLDLNGDDKESLDEVVRGIQNNLEAILDSYEGVEDQVNALISLIEGGKGL
jgi:DNA-binding response OmpR family regulator